jgi:hypothetical protein
MNLKNDNNFKISEIPQSIEFLYNIDILYLTSS